MKWPWKRQKRPLDGVGEVFGDKVPEDQSDAATGLPTRSGTECRWIEVERSGGMRRILVERVKKRGRR